MTPANVASLSAMLPATLSHRPRSCQVVSHKEPIIIDTTGPVAVSIGGQGRTAR